MTLPEGTLLQGRYEVVQPVKTGGMGAVYRARDLQFADRGDLALKEMLGDFSDPETQELVRTKFAEEARTLVRLSHPGIPRIWDHFLQGDIHYIVMEFIEGDSLDRLLEESLVLARAPLEPRRVVEMALQLCDILAYLHTRPDGPILHRDVKPANVILRRDRREVVLVDFGLARTFDAASLSTRTTVGTLGYAPMEQLQGHPQPSSDVYGLGATMYHLISGRRPVPFQRSRLSEALPGAPPALLEAVDRALEEDPAARPASVADMRGLLEKALSSLEAGEALAPRGQPATGERVPDTHVAVSGEDRTRSRDDARAPSSSLVRAARRAVEAVPPRTRRPLGALLAAVAAVVLVAGWRLASLGTPGASLFERPSDASPWRVARSTSARFTAEGLVLSPGGDAGGGPGVGGVVLERRASPLEARRLAFQVKRVGNPSFQVFVNDTGFEARDDGTAYRVTLQRLAWSDATDSWHALSAAPLPLDVGGCAPELVLPLVGDTRGAAEGYGLEWMGPALALSAGWTGAGAPATGILPAGAASPIPAPAGSPRVEARAAAAPGAVRRILFVASATRPRECVTVTRLRVE